MPSITPFPPAPRRPPQPTPAARVVIENSEAVTTSPEGVAARMPLASLLKQVVGTRPNTGDFILPDGVKAVIPRGPLTICIWEGSPRLHSLTWIAKDSPAPRGLGTKYRQVRVALPYIIILAVFNTDGSGQLQLTTQNECFFRNAPLKSLDDELGYPALLNCYGPGMGGANSLSIVCAAGLRESPQMRSAQVSERLRASMDVVRHYVLETGFNHSDGQGGRLSWFEPSRSLDPRLNTVEAWEEASAKDPLFVLDVPWIKSGLTVRQVIERMSPDSSCFPHRQCSAATLARLILNHQASAPPVPSIPAPKL